ncbi:MAG: response regulator [Pseudomonadota bacterium]
MESTRRETLWRRFGYPIALIISAIASAIFLVFIINEMMRPEIRWYAMKIGAIVSSLVATPICLYLVHKQRQVAEARDRAETAGRAKTQFLANMSHEIRTPMNGVIGMANLLRDTELTTKQHEMVDVIVSSSDALLKIINDILDFSRLEAGKLAMSSEAFALDAVVDDVAAMLAPRVQEKNLELVVRYEPGLPRRFVSDPGRLRQVIVNLVNNAVKFTDDGHIAIDVSGVRRGETCDVVVAVRDTGCGIPEEKLDAVFEKFEQVDGTSVRRFDGAGLGLSISRQIVETLGGRIWLESVVDEGSTFSFSVPLPVDGDAIEAAPDADLLSGLDALVVDDNAVNLAILEEQLAAWGVRVRACASAAEALGAVANPRAPDFAFAVVDFQMPFMDGRELALKLRETPFGARPLVLLSSAHHRNDPSLADGDPFDAVLTKPARAGLLFSTLTDALRARRDPGSSTSEGVEREPAEATAAGVADGANVLVAEDNVVNQMVLRSMLEKFGCRVTLANDGLEAIGAYENDCFDLVLMDVSMPVMGGEEATRRLRALQNRDGARLPIVAVTAHAMKEDRERFLSGGFDDCVTKPLTTDAVRVLLENWGPGATQAEQTAARA